MRRRDVMEGAAVALLFSLLSVATIVLIIGATR